MCPTDGGVVVTYDLDALQSSAAVVVVIAASRTPRWATPRAASRAAVDDAPPMTPEL
jgi:hypothetical protein